MSATSGLVGQAEIVGPFIARRVFPAPKRCAPI